MIPRASFGPLAKVPYVSRRLLGNAPSNQRVSHTPVKKFIKYFTIGVPLVLVGYDGLVNGFEATNGALRFGRSLRIAAHISADYSWSMMGVDETSEEYAQTRSAVHQRCANRLLHGCLQNGGLYIKIGQGIAAINHILPKEYTETLAKLQDKCLIRKPKELEDIFLSEFGKTPDEMFSEFDANPVAAASLAQVYRAKTKEGVPVAVKVQYIDLVKRFSGDFGTIQWLQSIIKCIHKDYNFSWILNDVRANLEQELDFINEARNSERCAAELAKFDYIHIPKVHWDLTSARIMTAEWIDGYNISNVSRMKTDKISPKDIDRKLFNAFSEQIFGTGFVHADPHPGNILIRKQQNGKVDIVLLDHGLYEMIPTSVRLSLCKFWKSIVLKDVPGMAKYAKELNVDEHDKLAEILMQRPLSVSGPSLSTRLTDEDIAYMQKVAQQRFDTILDTLRKMPRMMLFVVRNLNTIRAIARDHGDPIDRPVHMARYALKCVYRQERGWFARFLLFLRRVQFELYIFRTNVSLLFLWTKMRLLMILNANFDANVLVRDV